MRKIFQIIYLAHSALWSETNKKLTRCNFGKCDGYFDLKIILGLFKVLDNH